MSWVQLSFWLSSLRQSLTECVLWLVLLWHQQLVRSHANIIFHTFVGAERADSGYNNVSMFLHNQQKFEHEVERGTECYLVLVRRGLTSSQEGS